MILKKQKTKYIGTSKNSLKMSIYDENKCLELIYIYIYVLWAGEVIGVPF